MKERILKLGQGLFTPPLFAQDEKNQIGRQVFPILWFHVLIVLIIAVVLTVLAPEFARYWLALAFSTIVINLLLIVLTRKGRTRLASILLVGQLWLQISFLSWITSGFGSRAAWGYFLVVFIAGMLLGRLSGIIMAVVCSLSTLLLAVASPFRSSDPARFWLINSLYLLLVLLLQNLASRSIRELLAKTSQELRERLQAQGALQAREDMLSSIFRAAPTGIGVVRDRVLILVNNRVCEMTGRTQQELIGQSSRVFYPSDADFEYVGKEKYRQIAEKGTGTVETRWRRKDGRIIDVLLNSTPIKPLDLSAGVTFTALDITDRKQAEAALMDSNRFTSSLLRAIPVAVFFKDRDGKYTGCNDAYTEIMGVTSDELRGKTVQELWPGDLAETYHQKDLELMQSRQHQVYEFKVKDKHGHMRPVIFAKDVFLDANGEVCGMVGAFLDITTRKQMEEALRESEEKYRLTMDVAPIGIYIIQDLRFIFVNPEMARMHGYVPEEMIGLLSPPDDLVAPEHRELVRQTLLRRQAGVRGLPYEIRARRRDGSLFDALVWGQGISYEGKPASIGTLLDISERKHAEEAVRESEHRYHTLFEAASDSIFVMKDNLFFDCNSRTLEMFGCTRQQIIGVSPDRFSPPLQPDGRNSQQKAMEKITAAYSGIPQFFEWLHCRADGTPFIAEVSLNRFELASGHHLLAIVRDIAARKVLEEQLRQAQKMEAVGILAGGVAHDFNNILSTIVGYASLLQMQSCLEDKSKEYLERILASTERAASLTHSLLAFSRKQVIDLRPVDLNDSIFSFHKVLARLIGEDIEFILNLSKEHLMVEADIRQIEQVLMNLATNARDAMPHGGKLTITTRSLAIEKAGGEMPAGPYAVISMCDTGSGMEKETQDHLFEPFYTTKDVGKGTGLGLAIVYGIVKNHKGFIELESAFNRGTTFHIYLPLKFKALPKSKHRLQAKIPRGHETILLVEDDAAVRHVTRSMLEEFGYTIIEAADGQEALVVFEKNRAQIDLLLSDLIMPKKNGKETRDAILKLQPGIKTIFMSGYTSDIIARKGIMEPGMHLLLKPLHPAELLEKIRAVLDS